MFQLNCIYLTFVGLDLNLRFHFKQELRGLVIGVTFFKLWFLLLFSQHLMFLCFFWDSGCSKNWMIFYSRAAMSKVILLEMLDTWDSNLVNLNFTSSTSLSLSSSTLFEACHCLYTLLVLIFRLYELGKHIFFSNHTNSQIKLLWYIY